MPTAPIFASFNFIILFYNYTAQPYLVWYYEKELVIRNGIAAVAGQLCPGIAAQ